MSLLSVLFEVRGGRVRGEAVLRREPGGRLGVPGSLRLHGWAGAHPGRVRVRGGRVRGEPVTESARVGGHYLMSDKGV